MKYLKVEVLGDNVFFNGQELPADPSDCIEIILDLDKPIPTIYLEDKD